MKVTLPANNFGALLMLGLILLIIICPFVLVVWLLGSVGSAPWWVYVPVASLAALLSLVLTVKFKS